MEVERPVCLAARTGLVTRVLQLVKALVGDVNQLIGLVPVLGKSSRRRGPWSRRNSNCRGLQSFREDCLDTAAQCQGLRGIGLRQKKSELISTDSERGVRGTQRVVQGGRGGAEYVISARMTVFVVYFLEAMEVENDDAERKAVAACAIQFLLERLREQAAIVESGERIGNSADLEFLEFIVLENNRYANHSGRRQEHP